MLLVRECTGRASGDTVRVGLFVCSDAPCGGQSGVLTSSQDPALGPYITVRLMRARRQEDGSHIDNRSSELYLRNSTTSLPDSLGMPSLTRTSVRDKKHCIQPSPGPEDRLTDDSYTPRAHRQLTFHHGRRGRIHRTQRRADV